MEVQQQRLAIDCITKNQDDGRLITVVKLLWCRIQVFLIAAPFYTFTAYLRTRLPTVCISVHPVKSPLCNRLMDIESMSIEALEIRTTDWAQESDFGDEECAWPHRDPMDVRTIFTDLNVADLRVPVVRRLYIYVHNTNSHTTLPNLLSLFSNNGSILPVESLVVTTGAASLALDGLCKIRLPYLEHLALDLDIEEFHEDCLCIEQQGSCKITDLLSITTLTFLQLTVFSYDGCCLSGCPPAIRRWAENLKNGGGYTVHVMKHYTAGIADLTITFVRDMHHF